MNNEDYRLLNLAQVVQDVREILVQYFNTTLRKVFDTTGVDLYIGSAKHYVHEFIELYRRHNILMRGCPVNIQYIVNNAVTMLEDSFQHSLLATSHQVFMPDEHNIMQFGGTLIFMDMLEIYPVIYNNIMKIDDVIDALKIVLRHEIGHVYVNKNIFVYRTFEDYDRLCCKLSEERVARMTEIDRISDPLLRLKKYSEMPEEVWADKSGLVTPKERDLVNHILGEYSHPIVKITKPDIMGEDKSRRDI